MREFRGAPFTRIAGWVALIAILFPGLSQAAEQWIRLDTPHFQLYTTAGEKKGREAILYFEQVRSFFAQSSPAKRSESPVRIVAFRSENQYKPYRMNETALAYYTHSQNREYIVMQDISAEHYPVAIHEYTHLIIERDGLKLPLWLNEGWAELYSSLKPQGNKALVGSLLPASVQTLMNSKWLDVSVLAAVDEHSPLYNERDKVGIFYSESWLLTHMLYLSPDYRPNFTKFVLAVASGQDTVHAFLSVYGKGVKDVLSDLNQYAHGNRFYGAAFDVKLEKSAENPEVSEATPLDSGLVLADLLALLHKSDEARRAYQVLAKDNPGNPDIEESLGYLAWQEGDSKSAREHFSKSYEAGTKNARLCFDYAMLASQEGTDIAPILRRALDLKPDYPEARMQLGFALVNKQNYIEAIDQFHQIKRVNPEQAPSFFLALAYAQARTGHNAEARQDVESAKKWVKTPEDSQRAESIIQLLDALEKSKSARAQTATAAENPQLRNSEPDGPPELKRRPDAVEPQAITRVPAGEQLSQVQGMAQRLDCEGVSARLHVLVGRATMTFEIPDPNKVSLKHAGETTHDFTCGPQKAFPITVHYLPQPDPKQGTTGIVRELEF